MENIQDNLPEEDIINPEQFQVGRAPQNEKEIQEEEVSDQSDDAGYTPQEAQFADGKGTQLNEEIPSDQGDIEDELSEQVEGTFEDQKFGEEELDEDFKEEND